MALWESVLKERYDTADAFLQKELLDKPNEPIMCKKFGCGKKLSLSEQLHGEYCLFHQPEILWEDDAEDMVEPNENVGDAQIAGLK